MATPEQLLRSVRWMKFRKRFFHGDFALRAFVELASFWTGGVIVLFIPVHFKNWGLKEFVFLALALVASGYILYKAWKEMTSGALHFTRRELSDSIAAERCKLLGDEDLHAISMAGDLSYLDEGEIKSLAKLKKVRKRLSIFHAPMEEINPNFKRIDKIVNCRVYSDTDLEPPVKYLLVKSDKPELGKVFLYPRDCANVGAGDKTFLWEEYGHNTSMYKLLEKYAAVAGKIQSNPLKIGIVGVNNIGKTSLSRRLGDSLGSRGFKVKIIEDIFRQYRKDIHGYVTSEHNCSMLLKQILAETTRQPADIVIYDRTSVDNFCFWSSRHESGEKNEHEGMLIKTFRTTVEQIANKMDLYIYLKPSSTVSPKTTFTELPLRQVVDKKIAEFIKDHGLKHTTHSLNKNDIENVSNEVVVSVLEHYHSKST